MSSHRLTLPDLGWVNEKKKVIVPPAGWFEVIRKDTMVNHRVTWTPLTLIYRRTYERPFGHFLIWLCWAERGLCTRGGGRLGVVGFEWSRSALSLKGCNRRRDRGWYREEMLLDKVSFFWWPSGLIGIRQAGLEKRIVSVCFYSLNSGQCQEKNQFGVMSTISLFTHAANIRTLSVRTVVTRIGHRPGEDKNEAATTHITAIFNILDCNINYPHPWKFS